MDVTTCDRCGVYTPFDNWSKEDLCPNCIKITKEENENSIRSEKWPDNEELETFEDYIDHMIKEGYWAEEDLAPLKCHHCGSKNLEDKHWSYENLGVVEYKRWCNDCGKLVNVWSYGGWNL